jgi:hypothetical protein
MALYAGIRPGAVLMTDGYDVYDTVAEMHQLGERPANPH